MKPQKPGKPTPPVLVPTEIHLYHHFVDEPESATQKKLDSILAQLQIIQRQGALTMSKLDDITAQLDAIDTTTNEIAADIDQLIAGGLTGLSAEEADAVIARLTGLSDTLKSVAAKS